MKKWFFFISVAVFIVMGILASALGLDPEFGINSYKWFSFASGVSGIGHVVAILVVALLIVLACLVIVAALADIFNKNK